MLDQRRVAAQPDENCEPSFREQLFTDRYANLRVWAMYLTQNQSTADDLVHDLYVQWMLGRTKLEEIENIDGYLRTMLRYMHHARISRAAQHPQETRLSIADYDSCQASWTAIEPPRVPSGSLIETPIGLLANLESLGIQVRLPDAIPSSTSGLRARNSRMPLRDR